MDYAKPNYAVQQVNEAGRRVSAYVRGELTIDQIRGSSVPIVENWRSSHHFPLNAFYVTLKNRATKVSAKALAAQRIKRLTSIALKLFVEKEMKLSQMQDIGGCRAVMPTMADVFALRDLYNKIPLAHIRGADKDYISEPKDTGYRGIHLKYRYSGKGTSEPWNGLKIEIQLRTLLQHKWATAVEAAGTFTDQFLKSNQGRQEWLRFFALMSSVFSLREGCKAVPGTPNTHAELCEEIQNLASRHLIQEVFAAYHKTIPSIKGEKGAAYYLVVLDPIKRTTTIQGYKKEESRLANSDYTELETTLAKPTQVVLVKVASVSALKRAYPNYFLDIQDFLREISDITGTPA